MSRRSDMPRPYPKGCRYCGLDRPRRNHWKWAPQATTEKRVGGGRWKCIQQDRDRAVDYYIRNRTKRIANARGWSLRNAKLVRDRATKFRMDNPHVIRYANYKKWDKKTFGGGTLSLDQAKILMQMPCFYCGVPGLNGLDRKDSSKPHSFQNVVSCCVICNSITTDLPFGVKVLIGKALRKARKDGLLGDWIPAQYRNGRTGKMVLRRVVEARLLEGTK